MKWERITTALEIANQYGGIDGGHHKTWVIDQMVRALTGCPIVSRIDPNGTPYKMLDESQEYKEWVADHKAGEDGPETYLWDVGIPP